MAGRRSDTRERIQAIALELFVEQGYEGTSLREIADRLEVTKAALYYHFRTKEDIAASLLEEWAAALDELLAAKHPPAELLARYATLVEDRFGSVIGLLQRNIPALKDLAGRAGIASRALELHRRLCAGRDDEETHLRARLALFAVQLRRVEATVGEPRTSAEVALAVARDVLSPGGEVAT